jgi:hypothetical protein
MKAHAKLATVGLALAIAPAAEADYVGMAVESYVGEGWVEHGFADLSYFSLNGYNCATGNVAGSGWFADQVNNLVEDFSTTNAAWFVMDISNPAHQAGPELRVLLAQFVVEEGETISGSVNLQLYGGVQVFDQYFESPDPCPPDVNGDGIVNVLDLLAVLAAWGPGPGCPEDVNGDEIVNVLDLLEILAAWGPCP